jgi:uncharacterized protein (DUF433 family)
MSAAPKTVRTGLSERRFTTSEVGAMLGLQPIEVNNLIAEIAHLGVARYGKGRRTVASRGLFSLLVARELIHCQLKPEIRSLALLEASKAKGKRVAVPGTNLEILLDSHRKEVSKGLKALHEAETAVESRAAVMQGEPCIKGTRVPAYVVGAIATTARGVDEALATYPFLQKRQVELAQLFAKAHPRKGRPKRISSPAGGRVVSKKVIKRAKPRTWCLSTSHF